VKEIEDLFSGTVAIQPDPSTGESRLRAIGRTARGRHVFLVFTLRERAGATFIRPISARYMHDREVQRYEEEADPDVQD
jgi:uncharacterized DUF497 family protein